MKTLSLETLADRLINPNGPPNFSTRPTDRLDFQTVRRENLSLDP